MLATVLIFLIALQHLFFLVLEAFLWDKPLGCKVFGHSQDRAKYTKVLAQNQGLYNGFLAAGLLWGLACGEAGSKIKLFFLICIAIAGLVGGLTASKKILYIQCLPACLAILLLVVL